MEKEIIHDGQRFTAYLIPGAGIRIQPPNSEIAGYVVPATRNAGRDRRRIFGITRDPNEHIETQGGMTLDEAIRQCCEELAEELIAKNWRREPTGTSANGSSQERPKPMRLHPERTEPKAGRRSYAAGIPDKLPRPL